MDERQFLHKMAAVLRPCPKDLQPAQMTTFADLFCGIGGFHYAAAAFGMRCVFASDIDEDARQQYEHNFGLAPVGDILQVEEQSIPDHDVLFGGFPCQPFSIIGSQQGMEDERGRGTLIYEIVRVLRAKQPRAFMLENVRQLATMNDGEVIETILKELKEVGYESRWTVLNALNFGLPQKRERTIIVGFLDEQLTKAFEWPEPKKKFKPLADILEDDPPARFFVSERIQQKRQEAHTAKVSPAIWHENKGGNISSHAYSCALRAGASYNYLLVDGKRRLTPREQLRLQGFPEQFDIIGNDSQIRKQTGNAVPIPLVRSVLRNILHVASQNAQSVQQTRAASA